MVLFRQPCALPASDNTHQNFRTQLFMAGHHHAEAQQSPKTPVASLSHSVETLLLMCRQAMRLCVSQQVAVGATAFVC